MNEKLTAIHETDNLEECQQIKEVYEETYPDTQFRLQVKDNAKKGDLLPGFKRYTCIIKEI